MIDFAQSVTTLAMATDGIARPVVHCSCSCLLPTHKLHPVTLGTMSNDAAVFQEETQTISTLAATHSLSGTGWCSKCVALPTKELPLASKKSEHSCLTCSC